MRYLSDGSLDSGFGISGKVALPSISVYASVSSIVQLADGRLLAAGGMSDGTGTAITVARYNSDGSLDSTFGANGVTQTKVNRGSRTGQLLVRPDGKILVAGTTPHGRYDKMTVVRFHADGALDTTFGSDGVLLIKPGKGSASLSSLLEQPNGKVVAAGGSIGDNGDFAMIRF